MKKKLPFLIFLAAIVALVAVFSCDDDGDQREQTRRALGEPDALLKQSYGTYESEYWVYARRDINRVYEFRRTNSSCGGNGKWYLNMRYEANGYYFEYELYDHPPVITHEQVVSAEQGHPITIDATIELSDKATVDDEITGARLYYRTAGDSLFTQTGLIELPDQDNIFSAQIPMETVTTAGVEYYLEACSNEDTSVDYYWSRLPEGESNYFAVEVTTDADVLKAGFTSSTIDNEVTVDAPEPGDGAFSFTPMGQ